jgi:hypothetical protein
VVDVMSLDERVALFQFICIQNQMQPFVEAVKKWSVEIKQAMPSVRVDFLKNCFFGHIFDFDYLEICQHSESLAHLLISDLSGFQNMLSKIIFRLVKRIAARLIEAPSIWLDVNQVRIKIRPVRIPLETALIQKNGVWEIGEHCLVIGRITRIEPMQPIIIRYLYRCDHGECRHWSYRKPKDRFGAIRCRRCSEITHEDETGRISISSRSIYVQPDAGFAVDPILVVVKGDNCDLPFQLGRCVSVTGTVSFEPYRVNANVINISAVDYAHIPAIGPEFRFLFNELTSSAQNLFPQLIRSLLLSALAAVIRKSLVILVRDVDDLQVVVRVLELAFRGIASTFYPSKTLFSTKNTISCLLACEDGIALIPRYDMLSRNLRCRLDRAIEEKSVSGSPIKGAIICIAVAPALDGTEYQHFDFAVRIDSLPRIVVENFVFGVVPDLDSQRIVSRIGNGQQRIRSVCMKEDPEALIGVYRQWCQRNNRDIGMELVVQCAVACAAFRSDSAISELDVMLAIYFGEEKHATLSSDDSLLTELPKTQSFCDPEISRIRTTDDDTLFQCWCMRLRKLIEQ